MVDIPGDHQLSIIPKLGVGAHGRLLQPGGMLTG